MQKCISRHLAFAMIGSRKFVMIVVCCFCCCNYYSVYSTLIINVEQLFETFSPYAMLRFFDFSEESWTISENCLRDMYRFLDGLRRGSLWAFKLYDASSYYCGGGFGSIKHRIHNPSLCRALRVENSSRQRDTNHHIHDNKTPFPVHIVIGSYLLKVATNSGYKLEKIEQLICFPQSCTSKDLNKILQLPHFQANDFVPNNTYVKHRIVSDNYSIWLDVDFHMMLCIFGIIFLAYAAQYVISCLLPYLQFSHVPPKEDRVKGNVLDKNNNILLSENSNKNYATHNEDFNYEANTVIILPKIVTRSSCMVHKNLVGALSMPNVIYNLFDDSEKSVLSGIYFLFTLLLLYAHLSAEVNFMFNNHNNLSTNPFNFMVKYASYFFDGYFLLSASKFAVMFMQNFPKKQLQVSSHVRFILKLTLKKLFNILPSYTIGLYFAYFLNKYFHHNVAMTLPSYDYNTNNCKENKLVNLLYLDIFLPISERCMPWTWFISLELQFYASACLLLLLAQVHLRSAIIISATLFNVSILAATLKNLNVEIITTSADNLSDVNEVLQFNLAFDNLFLRIAPYLLGLGLGSILYHTNFNINLNAFILIAGWISSSLMMGFFFFAYDIVLYNTNQLMYELLKTISHTIWSFILVWTVMTAITQYGTVLTKIFCFKYVQVLEKLCPICLVLAPIVIRFLIFTSDAPMYASELQIFVMSFGCLFMTFMISLMLHVLLDGPLTAVLLVVFRD